MTPDFSNVVRLLDDARDARAFPAASIEVGTREAVVWQYATGRLTYASHAAVATPETVFDLASLTKVISTATLAMRLVTTRRLLLTTRVASLMTEWRGRDRSDVSLVDLLEHCAGLTSWWDLYKRNHTVREFAHEIGELPLEYRPRTRSIYSDLGFMLLGFILADVDGRPLDVQFASLLGDTGLQFRPPETLRASIAPTEEDRAWRGHLLVGEVHDENTAALGGVSGHAGLFGTADAVGRYARLVLATFNRPTRLGEPWLMRRFVQRSRVPRSSRALAWDTMLSTSSCGTRLSHAAIGHTGFTGTSLWIDPLRDIYVVLLTNRVHPQRPADRHDALARLRPAVHDAIVNALYR